MDGGALFCNWKGRGRVGLGKDHLDKVMDAFRPDETCGLGLYGTAVFGCT